MGNENKSNFSERLREIRRVRRWTQEELAKRLNVSANYVWMMEKQGREPGGKVAIELEKLERELDVVDAFQESRPSHTVLADTGAKRAQCLEYFRTFVVERCGEDIERLHWTMNELRERFPLSKWRREDEERAAAAEPPQPIHGLSSSLSEKARSGGRAAAAKVLKEHDAQSHLPKPPAHDSSADKP